MSVKVVKGDKVTSWLFPTAIALVALLVYFASAILLPFVFGFAVAYFLDPVADRLEEQGLPRGPAAGLVITGFFLLATGVLIAFWPILHAQLVRVAEVLPDLLGNIRLSLNELLATLSNRFNEDLTVRAEGLISGASTEILTRLQALAGSVFASGIALFNLIGLLLISPVVAYYLLRDWDLIVAEMNTWLPESIAPATRDQFTDIDGVLAGFVRGQVLICAIMGTLYGIGWSLVGLDFGLILGLLAGILAFVPFVGVLLAVGLAMLVGLGQWGIDPQMLGATFGVFLFVQILESAILTPRLVGEQVGLHPVWVLFAVFAGGELMGFLGVLIAVPAAASLAVIIRYTLREHKRHFRLDVREEQKHLEDDLRAEENQEARDT